VPIACGAWWCGRGLRLGWGDAMAKLEKRRDSDGRIRFTFRYVDVDGARWWHTPDVGTEPEALRIQGAPNTPVGHQPSASVGTKSSAQRGLCVRF
jgi:hypothetical protein